MSLGRKHEKILQEQGWGVPRKEEAPQPSSVSQPIGFPAMRRVFPSLLAQEIVSVQPMSLPSSLMFYTQHHYGNPLYKILRKAGLKVVRKRR